MSVIGKVKSFFLGFYNERWVESGFRENDIDIWTGEILKGHVWYV